MTGNDGEKPFETFSPSFYDFVRESIGKYLAWKGRYVYACGFTLQNITKCFEVGIAPPNQGVTQFESRYVCLARDLIISVHLPAKS